MPAFVLAGLASFCLARYHAFMGPFLCQHRRFVARVSRAGIVFLTAFMASCGPSAGPEPLPPSAGKIKETEVLLARLPAGASDSDVYIRPDGRAAAHRLQKGPKHLLVVDGKESPEFDAPARVLFSGDWRRVFYVGQRGGKEVVISDGLVSKPYASIQELVLSPDQKHWAFAGKVSDTEWVAVSDGVESRAWEEVADVTFSPDSQHSVYRAKRGRQWRVVLDSVEEKPYDFIVQMLFSSNSRRLFFVAYRAGSCMAVVDGVEGPPFARIDPPDGTSYYATNFFSDDSQHVAYIGRTNSAPDANGATMVIDGKPGREYDQVSTGRHSRHGQAFGGQLFSADSQHWRYRGQVGEEFFDEADGRSALAIAGLPPRSTHRYKLSEFVFSPDLSRYALIAHVPGSSRSLDRYVAVVDGVVSAGYRHVTTPVFSPDSKHVAFAAGEDHDFVVVRDGIEGTRHDSGIVQRVRIVFSPDSQRLAYDSQWTGSHLSPRVAFTVVDGTRSARYATLMEPPCFSPDSKHLAYWALDKDGKWRLFVDGSYTAGDYRPWRNGDVIFESPSKLYTLARRGDELLRLEVEILP